MSEHLVPALQTTVSSGGGLSLYLFGSAKIGNKTLRVWEEIKCPSNPQNGLAYVQGVDPDQSKISVSDRSIFLIIIKAEDAKQHWPRLLHSKGKVTNITVSNTALHADIAAAMWGTRRERIVLDITDASVCASPLCRLTGTNGWMRMMKRRRGARRRTLT